MDYRNLAQLALDACKTYGAEYADIRYEHKLEENLSISDGVLEPVEQTVSLGIGIRVIKNGAWGFAATDRLDENSIKSKAKLAIEIAEASALVNKAPVKLSQAKALNGDYISAHEIDPFNVPLDEKIAFITEIDKTISDLGGEQINSRNCFVSFRKREKFFLSSAGSRINQTLIHSGAGLSLGMAVSHRERYERSYPTSSGQYESKGY